MLEYDCRVARQGRAQMNADQRKLITGGLSKPSKMPGYVREATSVKLQAASKPQARTKHQASSGKLQASSRKQQAPGSRPLDKVSGTVDRGSLLRYTCL